MMIMIMTYGRCDVVDVDILSACSCAFIVIIIIVIIIYVCMFVCCIKSLLVFVFEFYTSFVCF